MQHNGNLATMLYFVHCFICEFGLICVIYIRNFRQPEWVGCCDCDTVFSFLIFLNSLYSPMCFMMHRLFYLMR